MNQTSDMFIVSPMWRILIKDLGLEERVVLSLAKLPVNLFDINKAKIDTLSYLRLIDTLELLLDKPFPLEMAKHFSTEAFDAPIFAAFCSAHLVGAVQRLQAYKPLICPIRLAMDFHDNQNKMRISVSHALPGISLTNTIGLTEMVFLTQLARVATRTSISALSVSVPAELASIEEYCDYFGCEINIGHILSISFASNDAHKPFLTANAATLAFLDDSLTEQLVASNEGNQTPSLVAQIKALLLEMIPAGNANIDAVAPKLASSTRNLQRRLQLLGYSFRDLVKSTQHELALYYLSQPHLSIADVGFLLGFAETNSFVRAFKVWQGVTPSAFKRQTAQPSNPLPASQTRASFSSLKN